VRFTHRESEDEDYFYVIDDKEKESITLGLVFIDAINDDDEYMKRGAPSRKVGFENREAVIKSFQALIEKPARPLGEKCLLTTPPGKGVRVGNYRWNQVLTGKLGEEMLRLKRLGYIEELGDMDIDEQGWGTPLRAVEKPDGSVQACMDAKALNKLVDDEGYPLVIPLDLVEKQREQRYISKIDLKEAFYHIEIAKRNCSSGKKGFNISDMRLGKASSRLCVCVMERRQSRTIQCRGTSRSWLGSQEFCDTRYYRPFIKNLAEILEPLKRKNVPFVWGKGQQEAFEEGKRQLLGGYSGCWISRGNSLCTRMLRIWR
jgi:hypothetical protein